MGTLPGIATVIAALAKLVHNLLVGGECLTWACPYSHGQQRRVALCD